MRFFLTMCLPQFSSEYHNVVAWACISSTVRYRLIRPCEKDDKDLIPGRDYRKFDRAIRGCQGLCQLFKVPGIIGPDIHLVHENLALTFQIITEAGTTYMMIIYRLFQFFFSHIIMACKPDNQLRIL